MQGLLLPDVALEVLRIYDFAGQVSGSNDGVVYTPLNGTAAPPTVFVRNQDDRTRYKYYRLDMTRYDEYIGIIEIFLFGR